MYLDTHDLYISVTIQKRYNCVHCETERMMSSKLSLMQWCQNGFKLVRPTILQIE